MRKLYNTPLILVGKMWADLVEWARQSMLGEGSELASEVDFKIPHCVNTIEETIALIRENRDGLAGFATVCPVIECLIPCTANLKAIFAAHNYSGDVGNTETVFQLKAIASMRKTKQQPIASNDAVVAGILKYRISNVNRLAPIKAAST